MLHTVSQSCLVFFFKFNCWQKLLNKRLTRIDRIDRSWPAAPLSNQLVIVMLTASRFTNKLFGPSAVLVVSKSPTLPSSWRTGQAARRAGRCESRGR